MIKMEFSLSEKRIIQAMYQLSRWATTNEIAIQAEVSWNTAMDTVKKLKQKEYVSLQIIGKKKLWILNY